MTPWVVVLIGLNTGAVVVSEPPSLAANTRGVVAETKIDPNRLAEVGCRKMAGTVAMKYNSTHTDQVIAICRNQP